jgi:hypothetical protein
LTSTQRTTILTAVVLLILAGVLAPAIYFGSAWITFAADVPRTDYISEYNQLAMKAAGISSPEENTWTLVDAISRDIDQIAEHYGPEWQDEPLYIDYSMLYAAGSTPEDLAAARVGMAELDRRGVWTKLDGLAASPSAARLFQADADMLCELIQFPPSIRQASAAITARMLAAWDAGDEPGAVHSFRHGLVLARIVAQQPTPKDRVVGLSMASELRRILRNQVLAKRPDAETLQMLIAVLADHTRSPIAATLEGERLVIEQTLYNTLGTSRFKPLNRGAQIARHREIYRVATKYYEQPRGVRDPLLADQLTELTTLGRPYLVLDILLPGFGSFMRTDDLSIADHQGTLLLMAIELFIARRGEPPNTLEDVIAAGILDKLPGDPFAPTGFVYRRLEPQINGGPDYILYSVGFDGHDDGGNRAETRHAAFFPQHPGTDFVFSLPDQ